MKKIKLLMPIVGVSTIAATAIPLASCNKNTYTDGVEVTADEWKAALTYLAACKEGASWKSSSEDVIQMFAVDNTGTITGWEELTNIAFNDDYGVYDGLGDDLSAADRVKCTSIRKNNCYFTFGKQETLEEKTKNTLEVSTVSDIQDKLTEIFATFGKLSDYTYDKETKTYNCISYDQTEGTQYSIVKMRFNSNKKITYINSHYGYIQADGSVSLSDIILHPVYDNVKVDVDQEFIDKANARVKEMTDSTLDITIADIYDTTINGRISFLLNITPKIAGATKLTLTCKEKADYRGASVEGIYKNNVLLEAGTDYTLDETTEDITFTNGLKTTDKITVAYNCSQILPSTTKTFTFTLA